MNWLSQFLKLWPYCANMHTTLQDGCPEGDPVTPMRLKAHQRYPHRACKPLSHTDAILAPKGKKQYASVTFTRSMTLKPILSRENNAKWLTLPSYLSSYEGTLADSLFSFCCEGLFLRPSAPRLARAVRYLGLLQHHMTRHLGTRVFDGMYHARDTVT